MGLLIFLSDEKDKENWSGLLQATRDSRIFTSIGSEVQLYPHIFLRMSHFYYSRINLPVTLSQQATRKWYTTVSLTPMAA